jgi:hypothetical protein
MTGRTAVLLAAALLLPALWGWFVPALLVRLWPPRPPAEAGERRPFPDYEI